MEDSVARIEELVRQVEALPDVRARTIAVDLVAAVMQYHAAAVARILEIVAEQPEGESIVKQAAGDELVSSLLVLHDLHPHGGDSRFEEPARPLSRDPAFVPLSQLAGAR